MPESESGTPLVAPVGQCYRAAPDENEVLEKPDDSVMGTMPHLKRSFSEG